MALAVNFTFNYRKLVQLFAASVIFGSALAYWKFYFFHFVLAFLLIVMIYKKCYSYRPVSNVYFIAPLCFFLWYLIGICWSLYPASTLGYLCYIFFGIAIIFAVSGWAVTVDKFMLLFHTIRNVVFFEYAVVFLEMAGIIRWPASRYSPYAVLLRRAEPGVIYTDPAPTGFYGNQNNLAVFAVMVYPFFLADRKFHVKIAGILITMAIIISTGSRGCFIAFLCGTLVYILLMNKKLAVFFIVFTFAFFLAGLHIPVIQKMKYSRNDRISEIGSSFDALRDYVAAGNTGSGDSVSVRKQLIETGLDELANTYGIGVGGGSFPRLMKEKYHNEIGAMHNFWAEILVEGGIPAFCLFILWYAALLLKLFRVYKHSKNREISYLSKSLFFSMLFFPVACISASSVMYNLTTWLMFAMAVSVIHLDRKSKAALKIEN